MAWIASHQSLANHRKTTRAAGALKIDRYKLIGHLHMLWWWAADNADADGRITDTSVNELAEVAGWPTKKADQFVDVLLSVGFLDRDSDGVFLLHDWHEYQGKRVDKADVTRDSDAERQRKHRAVTRDIPTLSRVTDSDGHAVSRARPHLPPPTNIHTNIHRSPLLSPPLDASPFVAALIVTYEGMHGELPDERTCQKIIAIDEDFRQRHGTEPPLSLIEAAFDAATGKADPWAYAMTCIRGSVKSGQPATGGPNGAYQRRTGAASEAFDDERLPGVNYES